MCIWMNYGGVFDITEKQQRLRVVDEALNEPDLWQSPEKLKTLQQERSQLFEQVDPFIKINQAVIDLQDLLALAIEEQDEDTWRDCTQDLEQCQRGVVDLETRLMFDGPHDADCAFVDVQAGSGGTEAQDWAQMLLRMYTMWADKHGFSVEMTAHSPGEVAGIKGATLYVKGAYAYGWLRGETGVHRLVRKSPFDSGNRRHTSFASIFVSPEISEAIEVDLDPSECRVDTYRASGAGGQHVNTTDSAVRITHEPTGIVVQCQNDRSQHKNRAQALKQLRAKLYQHQLQMQMQDQMEREANKDDITWGRQIRSYVLDDARIKDLRTGVESRNTGTVLDGDLDAFMEAFLKSKEEDQ